MVIKTGWLSLIKLVPSVVRDLNEPDCIIPGRVKGAIRKKTRVDEIYFSNSCLKLELFQTRPSVCHEFITNASPKGHMVVKQSLWLFGYNFCYTGRNKGGIAIIWSD